jgi:hypothetical protein
MKHFLKYLITWIAGNLSIPFWMVGHVHLTMNVYHDLVEVWSSIGMNLLVATGFYLEWKEYRKNVTKDV